MYTGTGVNQSQTYRWYLLLYSPAGAYLYCMLLTLVDVSMRLLFGHLRASLSVMLLLVHANSIHMTSVVTSAGAYV